MHASERYGLVASTNMVLLTASARWDANILYADTMLVGISIENNVVHILILACDLLEVCLRVTCIPNSVN